MQIQENISLKPYNTFSIDAKARWFAPFTTPEELSELLESKPQTSNLKPQTFILGGGSNILFTKDFDGLVLKNEIRGIELITEDADHIYVRAGAGENWHAFVQYCISRNWAGVENLSLIPGNIGASPIQNIGAYGVELESVFHSLEALRLDENKLYTFTNADCEFGYRDSVFKRRYKSQFAILAVTFKLNKHPVYHTSYGAIRDELEKMEVKELSIQAISQAVIRIRSSKLPDPQTIPNAGSFFKNPEIEAETFKQLQSRFKDIIGHELVNGKVKLAAGWMIEQCGWKGYRKGDAGCHAKQALVLVNYGHAKGDEIYDLSEKILINVKEKFGVELEREVNLL